MSPIDRLRAAATAPVAAVSTGEAARGSKGASEAAPRSAVKAAPQQGVSVELGSTVDASQPPVDAERVEQIREALKDGSYPIVPAKVADAMIAARMMLGLGE